MREADAMKRAIPLSAGLAAGGLAVVAARHWRRAQAERERALLEAEILAGLEEVEAERALLNAEFAARL
jgi:hypothetical protein